MAAGRRPSRGSTASLRLARFSGPEGLKQIRGFRDEALRGHWQGHRSSRLNLQYRVIYRVEQDRVIVEVVAVTPHDYRRK